MELPFAGLHQLMAGLLEGRERLPALQRDAVATAFGLSSGAQPDRFLVGLAVLSLLSEAAEAQPLVCLVDDVQWLDRSSAQVLAFVARRLAAESVVLLFAGRLQPLKTLGEDVRADAGQTRAQVAEPLGSQQEFAHHEQRPALAHEIERVRGRARVLVAAAGRRPGWTS